MYKIRYATSNDYHDFNEIYLHGDTTMPTGWRTGINEPEYNSYVRNRSIMLMYDNSNRLVGYAICLAFSDVNYVHVADIFICPQECAKFAYRHLYDFIIDETKKIGFHKVITVSDSMEMDDILLQLGFHSNRNTDEYECILT